MLLPTATLVADSDMPACPGAPEELGDGGSSDEGWGESPAGVALIVAESRATRSQKGCLPSHNLASRWSLMRPGNFWKGPGPQQQFSYLGTVMDCAGMLSASETAETTVYSKKKINKN